VKIAVAASPKSVLKPHLVCVRSTKSIFRNREKVTGVGNSVNVVRLRIQMILEKIMTLVEIFQLMKEMKFCLTASLALSWESPSWIEGLEM
jgi:hypothetical protein